MAKDPLEEAKTSTLWINTPEDGLIVLKYQVNGLFQVALMNGEDLAWRHLIGVVSQSLHVAGIRTH